MIEQSDCVRCQLEQFLRERSCAYREVLRRLNPNVDQERYDALFDELIAVEQDLRILRGRREREDA